MLFTSTSQLVLVSSSAWITESLVMEIWRSGHRSGVTSEVLLIDV